MPWNDSSATSNGIAHRHPKPGLSLGIAGLGESEVDLPFFSFRYLSARAHSRSAVLLVHVPCVILNLAMSKNVPLPPYSLTISLFFTCRSNCAHPDRQTPNQDRPSAVPHPRNHRPCIVSVSHPLTSLSRYPLEYHAKTADLVGASTGTHFPAESGALVRLALLLVGGSAKGNLGVAADGAAGEGVAFAAAAVVLGCGRCSGGENGETGQREEGGECLHCGIRAGGSQGLLLLCERVRGEDTRVMKKFG